MLTPRFSCSQTENTVTISIYVPSVRAADVEIHVEGTLFSLHINPYFLRLNFPKRVQEDDTSSAKYDPSTGFLTVVLSKDAPGEHFEDLDLLAKLLAPTSKPKETHPVIEVIDNKDEAMHKLTCETEGLDLRREHDIFLEAAKNDWQLPQSLPDNEPLQLVTSPNRRYGFLDTYSGYFRHSAHGENEANDLGPDAEIFDEEERRRIGEERVDAKFDEDYYLADFVNDEEIHELIRWQHPYSPELPYATEFSEHEKLVMLQLPRKEYLPTASQTNSLYLTLVAILFSAAYDTRTTFADPTTESAWTISVLTPAFASLSAARTMGHPIDVIPPHDGPPAALVAAFMSSYRRALSFPLYRSFALCERCRIDVADILSGGRRRVLRALLSIKNILDKHDVYYIYSKIWIDDYCVWVQSLASEQSLCNLSTDVRATVIEKRKLGWDLDELEHAAKEALERAPDSDDEEDEVERMGPVLL